MVRRSSFLQQGQNQRNIEAAKVLKSNVDMLLEMGSEMSLCFKARQTANAAM